MFETFEAKGLNNLIWVWTSESDEYNWYPGDAYVDIVGCDLYNKSVAESAIEFNKLKDRYDNKMISLSECGSVGNLSQQWSASATWSWFMPWYDHIRTDNTSSTEFDKTEHNHVNIEWWNNALQMSSAIIRDQMPDLK